MSQKFDLDIIDLNAYLYSHQKDCLDETLLKIERKMVVVDNLDLRPLYYLLLPSRKEILDNISWRDYAKIFITVPSWFVTVATKELLFLTDYISNHSPKCEFFFYGNSLGTWTDINKLMAHKIQIRHLNDLLKPDPHNEPVRYDTFPSPVYDSRNNYIFDMLPFRLKHGCSWGGCRFCSLAKGWNSGYLERSAEKVIKEIETLVDEYDPKMFVCRDNTINGDNLFEFCNSFKDFKKPWIGMARADLTEKEIKALQKSGCQRIYFGLESGSDRVLKAINKGIEVGQLSKFIKLLHHNQIAPSPSLFAGSPHETEEDFNKTVQFISNHREYIDMLNLYPLRTTPGSDYTLAEKTPHPKTFVRLKKLIRICVDAGIKVCVGEQSAEYFIFKNIRVP